MFKSFTNVLFSILLIGFLCIQCNTTKETVSKSTAGYDESMAMKYGADDYGMRQYVIAFLKSGPNRPTDKAEANKLQAAHMANIGRLAEEGKLILAGPFMDNGDLRGLYVFDVRTIEEARELTATDPAIKAGSLVMELHPWYGSAATMAIPEIHKRIQKVEM